MDAVHPLGDGGDDDGWTGKRKDGGGCARQRDEDEIWARRLREVAARGRICMAAAGEERRKAAAVRQQGRELGGGREVTKATSRLLGGVDCIGPHLHMIYPMDQQSLCFLPQWVLVLLLNGCFRGQIQGRLEYGEWLAPQGI
ncbi:unnamed protein product [Linum trigynum]|uniref:Uncharacterized protein n=1 Tax=Linum trigynum TaxID=586398 RepID=A0AAV2CNG2_9ROSI